MWVGDAALTPSDGTARRGPGTGDRRKSISRDDAGADRIAVCAGRYVNRGAYWAFRQAAIVESALYEVAHMSITSGL